MEAVEQPQNAEDLRLLLNWDTEGDDARHRRAGIGSIAVHLIALVILFSLPREVFRSPIETRHVTPLVAPPLELTQNTPNRGKISKEFNIQVVKPRPRIQIPPPPPSTTRSKAPALSMPEPKASPPAALPEPPKIDVARQNGPKLPENSVQAPPPPQIQPEEQPKLAFENPKNPESSGKGGLGKLAPPSTSVTEAVRSLAHSGGGGLVVGDIGAGASGIEESINQPLTPGKQGSNLELLSDPMGVDFRPYLLQLLATVRRNWFAVMPESAKLGRRGKVAIQFAIAKNGAVTKVVFATNSGFEAFDRAAVASISMSNPFPPLPTEFHGNVVRLQFSFMYNAPTR